MSFISQVKPSFKLHSSWKIYSKYLNALKCLPYVHLSTCCGPDGRENGKAFLSVTHGKEEKLANDLHLLHLGGTVGSIRCGVGGLYVNKNVDSDWQVWVHIFSWFLRGSDAGSPSGHTASLKGLRTLWETVMLWLLSCMQYSWLLCHLFSYSFIWQVFTGNPLYVKHLSEVCGIHIRQKTKQTHIHDPWLIFSLFGMAKKRKTIHNKI